MKGHRFPRAMRTRRQRERSVTAVNVLQNSAFSSRLHHSRRNNAVTEEDYRSSKAACEKPFRSLCFRCLGGGHARSAPGNVAIITSEMRQALRAMMMERNASRYTSSRETVTLRRLS